MTARRTDEVIYAADGRCARITLDRPRAMNALTLAMVRALEQMLDEALFDDAVAVVFLEGAGERAFCAGGDIVALRDSALAGDGAARVFWEEEYRLNARIASFAKPIVAFMDGVVMGGGIGLAGHASHRVATERLTSAMPEVGIGFAPDVGGTWLLSRSPGELGTHLALTGARIAAADAILVGLADHQVSSEAREALAADLAGGGDADAAVARHAVSESKIGEAPLSVARPWIDAAYRDRDDVTAIVAALRDRTEPDAHAGADAILRASPTSVTVTLAEMRRARGLATLEACLAQELGVSLGFLSHPDFAEGIRAQVVDKDRRPTWSPSALGEVDPGVVTRFLTSVAVPARQR